MGKRRSAPASPARVGRARARGGALSLAERDAADVVRSLRRLVKGLHEYSKALQQRSGLSSPQAWALSIIEAEAEAGGGLRLGELAERMYAHPSTVSGIMERLVTRGIVRRETDPRDRRGIRLSLTPAGRRLLKSSPPPIQVGLRRALVAMPPARLRILRASLAQVARVAELDRIEAPFFVG
jgi:DNA-binding MarR family transcriptional regulator